MKKRIVVGILLTLFLIGMLMLALKIQPIGADPGTIYIRADGSIDPPTARITSADNITYTFADNIYGDTIAVERNNIVVDGNGYTLQGTGFGAGIYLRGRTNVTVRNTQVKNFEDGIDASVSWGNMISGNNITANSNDGVYIRDSHHITVSGNNITKNSRDGVRLEYSSNTDITVSGNNITANSGSGVHLYLLNPWPWGITVAGNNIANSYYGVYLDRSKGSLGGISVAGNNIANNFYGAFLSNSTNIMVSGNNMTANYVQGVWGEYSFDNMISGNSITNSVDGIYFDFSDNNMISGNNIANNSNGVYLDSSSTNEFYHNNFMNNSTQVIVASSDSSWDDGYPSGGNYWSDYSGTDEFSGPYQNETGSDFRGDTEYKINDYNIDHYPLMIPYETTPPTIIIISPENKTYAVNPSIPLTFTIDKPADWIGYSLNGQTNATITENTTMPNLPDGWHYMVVYTNDTFGNMGMSIVYFTVDTTKPNITNVSQEPPTNVLPDTTVKINATVTDATSGTKQVLLNCTFTNSTDTWSTVFSMTPLTGDIWNATILPHPYGTNVTYVIIAEDNAGNTITTEQIYGYKYEYQVVPEFPSFLILPLFMIATLLAVIFYKRKTSAVAA